MGGLAFVWDRILVIEASNTAKMPAIIDISDFDTRRPEITAELLHAGTREGFMYVTGHGITEVMNSNILPNVEIAIYCLREGRLHDEYLRTRASAAPSPASPSAPLSTLRAPQDI